MKRTLVQISENKANRDITSFFKKSKVETKPAVAYSTYTQVKKQTSDASDEKDEQANSKENSANETKAEPTTIRSESQFDKGKWVDSLNTEQKQLLSLEINTLHESWLALLHRELTKPYFLQLKRFVIQEQRSQTIFPPAQDIYSWSRLTPLHNAKVLIIGQDPYHNFNQAHGLAFSVKNPDTKIPPSLQNIYKTIAKDYPEFVIPKKNANLTSWATNGVLMLNTCLTVRAHNANSHSNKGWEQFTKEVVRKLIEFKKQNQEKLCVMCWGGPAQKLLTEIAKTTKITGDDSLLILKSCHPSPLSAHRGDFFNCKHFVTCNEWLGKDNHIKWTGICDSV